MSAESNPKKKVKKVRIYIDLFFFALMVFVLIPQSTGIGAHEWASFIILAPFLVHLVINWDWIRVNSKKFFKTQTKSTRFDYILNWLLYSQMLLLTVSGILISEVALPVLGIPIVPDKFWSIVHDISSLFFMVILGIHIALHWTWIKGAFAKFRPGADIHHLIKLGSILSKNITALIFLVLLSIVLSLAIWGIDYLDWIDTIRSDLSAEVEEEKKMPFPWLIYVLPMVKITVIMTVPALITGALLKFKNRKRVGVDPS